MPPKPTKPESRLAGIQAQVLKEFGGEGFLIPSDAEVALKLGGKVKVWLSSTAPALDAVLGREGLGLPCGKLIEIFGPESHGKSSLLYWLLGKCQEYGGWSFLFDTEESYDEVWGAALGVNNKEIGIYPKTPDMTLEWTFDTIHNVSRTIRAKDPDSPIIFGIDTVYCMPTVMSLKAKSFLDSQGMLGLPRSLNDHLPKMCSLLTKYKACLIFVNQIRDNVGVVYGAKYTTPGGHALKHMASVRIQVSRTTKVEATGAIESAVHNIKNKVGIPYRKAIIQITPKGLRVRNPAAVKESKEALAAAGKVGVEGEEE